MTNAFTAKPDVSWLKKADLSKKMERITSKRASKPTPAQQAHFHRDYNASKAAVQTLKERV